MKCNILKQSKKIPVIFHGMVTVSPNMLALFAIIQKVAATESSIFIRGATGTGKELVARAIHGLSLRKGRDFFALNCASLSVDLMRSELFGHVRGAFTGAVQDHKGLFELANNGTLFLDEISEMPLDVQARLLRVLESRTFVRLGGTVPQHTDIRFLSATNESLRLKVDSRQFRQDLMYRIRVVPIYLPRLRERRDDIPVLVWHFIREFNQRGWCEFSSVEQKAMDAMLAYDWPGNVRELRNNIEYAFAVSEGTTLLYGDLTPELRGEAAFEDRQDTAKSVPSPTTLKEVEKANIMQALAAANLRREVAAKSLGMSRSTLWRKCREHGLL